MYNNIQHEAVFPPAIFSIRRMSHQGQARNGSYEMYDPQQSVGDSFGEKRLNGIGGSAPGSPGSVHDYRQVVVNLQRELEESKRKGSELQDIIASLNSPTSQPSSSLVDSQFVEGSSSNDTIGESVKDAHIKHLQRQVTILQANLYKCEGWANRVANSMKERDKAVDDVTRLTNQIKNMEGDNQQMQQRIDTLNAALQETQQNLRQVSEELQGQTYNGQMVAHLRDEVQRQKNEITTLKQSLAHLDEENRSLKDSGIGGSGQSVGNMACSLELEHLHLVVDKLKSIVLEQRAYLLQLKKPANSRNGKSLSSGSSGGQDLASGRKLASPTLRVPGNVLALGNLPQQVVIGQVNQAAGLKSSGSKENLLDSKTSLHRKFSSTDFSQEDGTGMKRKFSSRDVLDEVIYIEDLNKPRPLPSQGEMFLASEHRPETKMGGSSYLVENVHRFSPEGFGQQGSGDMAEKKAGLVGQTLASRNVQIKLPLHRTSQSEVLAHRSGQETVALGNWGSKSEIIGRQTWNMSSDNTSRTPAYKPVGSSVDKFVQLSPAGPTSNQGQRFVSAKQGQKELGEAASNNIAVSDLQRRLMGNGSAVQTMLDNSTFVRYENVDRNTFQPHLIYHPPTSCPQGSAQVINSEMMNGGKQMTPRPPIPCTTSHRPGQDVLYVNTSSGQNSSSTPISSSPVDLDPSRARQNADRLCPVCSHDYSHVSMEDFQTHVLECFEDENPPETMKPPSPPNRSCPMCNARFSPETPQLEFENHVHGHFSEDCNAENFEILS